MKLIFIYLMYTGKCPFVQKKVAQKLSKKQNLHLKKVPRTKKKNYVERKIIINRY